MLIETVKNLDDYVDEEATIKKATHDAGILLAQLVIKDVDAAIASGEHPAEERLFAILGTVIDVAVTGVAIEGIDFIIRDVQDAFQVSCANRAQIAKQKEAH